MDVFSIITDVVNAIFDALNSFGVFVNEMCGIKTFHSSVNFPHNSIIDFCDLFSFFMELLKQDIDLKKSMFFNELITAKQYLFY